MRAFDVTAVAIAIRMDRKALDNLLARHQVAGVVGGRQGVARRITPHAVVVLAIAMELVRRLSVPVRSALELAEQLLASDDGRLALAGALTLEVDAAAVSADVAERLRVAGESVVPRRRGRPSRMRRYDDLH